MNVYYDPEKFGLTVFGEAEADGGYSFDTFVVWRNAAGDFLWATDSGCSCPVPFEDYSLANLPIGSARDALTDLVAWADDPEADYDSSYRVGPSRRRSAAEVLFRLLEAVTS